MAPKKAASPKTEPSKHLTGTTHKDRAQWYFSRSTFPLRDAPPVAIERFWDHLGEYNHVPGAHWKESGPSNIAGRVTCLLMDPGNPQRMYAGTAAGRDLGVLAMADQIAEGRAGGNATRRRGAGMCTGATGRGSW